MDRITNGFGNNLTTARACSRCASRVYVRHTSTSFLRFVGGELHAWTPSHIGNAAGDGFVAGDLHSLNVEFFKGDELVCIDPFAGCLVRVVWATVGSTSVGVWQGTHNLASFWTTLRELFFLTLQASNVFGVSAHPTLTINLVTMAEIGECRQAKIDTNNLSGWRQRLGFTRTRKASVAGADRFALDRQGLNLSTDFWDTETTKVAETCTCGSASHIAPVRVEAEFCNSFATSAVQPV